MSLLLPVRKTVLDKGWMQLEEMMGGDAAVIRGARICYQSTARSEQADVRLIERLMSSIPRHNTVFEHAVFRFAVKAPLFVARQWMRHRICTFNEKSLRYCIADREYYVPDQPEGREDLRVHALADHAANQQPVNADAEREHQRGDDRHRDDRVQPPGLPGEEAGVHRDHQELAVGEVHDVHHAVDQREADRDPVSYTHLTLPTIDPV